MTLLTGCVETVKIKCPSLTFSKDEISFLEKHKKEAGSLIINLDKHKQKLEACQ